MDLSIESKRISLIETPEDLAEMVDWLSHFRIVAVDTESDSLFVYYEKVCLIQFSAGNRDFIIDPLVVGELSRLDNLFASAKMEKIFHAAEYDIICLKRDFGFTFNNIFDTMIAARILSRTEFGLGALIEQEFGVHLEKKYQKSNWGVRPLSNEMLLYATLDTHYLPDLKKKLAQELNEKGLMELAQEDFIRLCGTLPGIGEPEMINWWKIAGNHELSFRQAATLQGLCEMRESSARARDLPPFKTIQNNLLLEIALALPKNEDELRKITGVSSTFMHRYAKTALQIVRESGKARTLPRPAVPIRPANGLLARKEKLKSWRKNKGISCHVPSDVILPKDVLEKIAAHNPPDEETLKKIMADCPWRFRHFADEILQSIHQDH